MLSSIGRATHEAREHSPSLHEHSKALRTESLGKGVSLVAVAVGKFTVKLLPRPKINGSLVLCSHMALGFAKAVKETHRVSAVSGQLEVRVSGPRGLNTAITTQAKAE